MDQEELIRRIEARFAEVNGQNLRHLSRELERLVRGVEDPRARLRYESALDQLPDMVKHLDEGR